MPRCSSSSTAGEQATRPLILLSALWLLPITAKSCGDGSMTRRRNRYVVHYSCAKISFFVYGRHGSRGCVAFHIFSKKFRLIREIRVPTGLIPDFATAMCRSSISVLVELKLDYNHSISSCFSIILFPGGIHATL
jgi:hypothetical protein